MSGTSAIEWTEATWNPVTGCDRVSPGCAHCYALDLAARLKAMGQPKYQRDGDPKTSGPGFGVTLHPDTLNEPLRWRRPRMVFVNSMSDLFHEEIPDEFVAQVWNVMSAAKQHIYQVLTKRPERALGWFRSVAGYQDSRLDRHAAFTPLPNVWLGVSIENARYTWRADVLREIPAAVRFISAEPLLGSLFDAPPKDGPIAEYELTGERRREGRSVYLDSKRRAALDLTGIDWLIVGGESGGHHTRPMHPDWARELRDACVCPDCGGHGWLAEPGPAPDLPNQIPCERCGGGRDDTAFFFKQWGSWIPDESAPGGVGYDGRLLVEGVPFTSPAARMRYVGPSQKSGGRLLDGREWNEMPTAQAVPA